MIKELYLKVKEKLPHSKSLILIVLGIIGILLVLLSSFTEKRTVKDNEASEPVIKTSINCTDYSKELENKLGEVISDMLGGSKVTVMVTLKNGSEFVYADDRKTNAETLNDRNSLKTEQNDSNQSSYVVIKDADGNEHALIVTEKMPVVEGVVVVCKGGQNGNVAEAVKSAVRSALSIDDDKICVIGRG